MGLNKLIIWAVVVLYLFGLLIGLSKGFGLTAVILILPLVSVTLIYHTWLVAILLPIIIYLPEYKIIAGFGYKSILISICVLFLLSKNLVAHRRLFPPKFLYLTMPFLTFIVWIFIASFHHYGTFNFTFFRFNLIKLLPQWMIAFIIAECIDSWKKLDWLVFVICLVGIWLSFVGFSQIGGIQCVKHYLNIELQLLRVKSSVLRAFSIFSNAVSYSYTMLALGIFTLGVGLRQKCLQSNRLRYFALGTSIIAFLSLLTTITRSSNLAALLGISVLLFSSKVSVNRISHFIKVFLIFLVVFPILTIVANYFYSYLREPNAIGRYTLFLAGLKIAIKHPFWGVGPLNYPKEAFQFVIEAEGLPYLSTAARTTSHNQFLLIFSFYGLPGLFLLLWFCYRLFCLIGDILKEPLANCKCWGITLLAVFAGLTLTSGYHNSGFFITHDKLIWIFIGLPVVIKNLAATNYPSENAVRGSQV